MDDAGAFKSAPARALGLRMTFGIGWLDWAMAATLVLSVVVGALRGLVFEVAAILGWFVAYFVAVWAAPLLSPYLPVGARGSLLNQAAAFASAFIAALVVWGFLSRLLRRLVRATPLAPIDRVLGAGFGLIRGLIVLLVVVAVAAYTPLTQTRSWQESVAVAWLGSLLQVAKPLLAPDRADLPVAAGAERLIGGKNSCAA